MLDGELVILGDDGIEEFDALQNRIHPAASRINRLPTRRRRSSAPSTCWPTASEKLLERPFRERRRDLEKLVGAAGRRRLGRAHPAGPGRGRRTQEWLRAGEGVIAKLLEARYLPGERKGMVKVKRLRTADCVVVGWRPGKEEGTVGSLILGLHDGEELRVVGHTSGLKAKQKRELVATLAPYATGDRGSADPSRWAADRDLEWVALRPELVIEVSFDHVSSGRIRHGAKIIRWRDDKDPDDCLFEQLEQ